MSGNFIDVAILGREYRVACPPGEQEALLAAVAYVDRKMQDIAAKSKTAAAERVAGMAALNITNYFPPGRRRAPQKILKPPLTALTFSVESEPWKHSWTRPSKARNPCSEAFLAAPAKVSADCPLRCSSRPYIP